MCFLTYIIEAEKLDEFILSLYNKIKYEPEDTTVEWIVTSILARFKEGANTKSNKPAKRQRTPYNPSNAPLAYSPFPPPAKHTAATLAQLEAVCVYS